MEPHLRTHPAPKQQWQKNTALLFIGQALSLLGSTLVSFALVWWLTTSTGSATLLTTGSIAYLLPAALIGPFSGALIDRYDRRWVIAFCDGIIMLGTLGLAFLFWSGAVKVWHLFVLFPFSSILGMAQWSAMQALISSIVPENQLQRVQGINSALRSGILIAGPPLGALLMSLLSIGWVLSLDVITAAIALSMLVLIRIPTFVPQNISKLSVRTVIRETGEGFQFLLSWKGMLWVMIAVMVMQFFHQPFFSLLPLLITDFFGRDAMGFALSDTAWAIGTLLGGGLLTIWGGLKRKHSTIILGMIVQSIFLLLMAYAPPNGFFLILIAMFVVGVTEVVMSSPLMALMQGKIPEQWQGRFFSLLNSFTQILAPVSLAIAGPLSDWLGIKIWFVIGSWAMVLATVVFWFNPHLRHLEDEDAPQSPRTAEELAASSGAEPSAEG